jgi:hypothetical protein
MRTLNKFSVAPVDLAQIKSPPRFHCHAIYSLIFFAIRFERNIINAINYVPYSFHVFLHLSSPVQSVLWAGANVQ